MIYDNSGADTNPNQLYLKGITYYNLSNSKYRTAMTLTLLIVVVIISITIKTILISHQITLLRDLFLQTVNK